MESDPGKMLVSRTDPEWLRVALGDFDRVLVDHAHCEKKAAGMAINLMFRYPRQDFLMEPLSRLAREELSHFEAVLRVITERGGNFGPQKPAPYPPSLPSSAVRRGVIRPAPHPPYECRD